MPVALWGHTATLLSNGTVLVAGGNSGGETTTSLLYNPNLNSWTTTAPLNTARFDHNAILLPDGGVLVSGGFTASGGAVSSVEIYIPSAQAWVTAGNMPSGKGGHTTTLSSVGTVFDIGGLGTQGGSNYLSATDQFPFSVTPDINTSGAPPSLRQPVVNAINIPVLLPGAALTITGSHFHGNTEASGGGASSANSDQNKPRMVLQAVDSGNSFLIDLSTYIYANNANLWTKTDSSITITLPPNQTALPYGWYQLREADNAQFSSGLLVHAGPPLPTLAAGAPIPTILSSGTVSWSWTAAGGTPGVTFDGYDVYSATSGVFLSTIAYAQTSYLEAGLAPNTTVQLLVAPYTLSGDGPGTTSGISYTFAANPQSLLISSNTGSNLMLSWDPNNNSRSTIYELSESTDGFVNSFSTPIPTSLTYTSTQTSISNLQMDTTYYFRVRAFNSNGIPSGFSNIATTTTVNQVSNLTGSPGGTTSINWSWTSPSLPPGGYFVVYNATTSPEVLITTTTNSYFSDVALSTNSPRAVQVGAITSAGEGPLTSTVTVYTSAAIPAFVSPPIVAISSGGFTGQWAPNGNPANTGYQCTVTGVNLSSSVFTGFTTSSGTAQSCSISQLPLPGSFYQTQVVAINGDGVLTTPLTLGATETLATPPTNLSVIGTTAGSISISWSSGTVTSSITINSPLDSYQITYSTDNFVTDISTALPFSAQSNQSTMTISGLIGGYTYEVRAQAQNQNGVLTAFSNFVTTITFNQGAPPGTLGAYVIASSQTLISGMMGNGETVSLLIPANSLSGNTFIIISTISTSPSLCPGTGSGVGVSVTANPPLEPLTPLTLNLSYFSSQIPATPTNFLSQASLMRVTGTSTCVPVETQINAANNQLTAKHISQFELAQVAPGTGVNSAIIFPNPF